MLKAGYPGTILVDYHGLPSTHHVEYFFDSQTLTFPRRLGVLQVAVRGLIMAQPDWHVCI